MHCCMQDALGWNRDATRRGRGGRSSNHIYQNTCMRSLAAICRDWSKTCAPSCFHYCRDATAPNMWYDMHLKNQKPHKKSGAPFCRVRASEENFDQNFVRKIDWKLCEKQVKNIQNSSKMTSRYPPNSLEHPLKCPLKIPWTSRQIDYLVTWVWGIFCRLCEEHPRRRRPDGGSERSDWLIKPFKGNSPKDPLKICKKE